MKEDNTPLVSVVVVAYNSSSTVLETLESIKNQTYRNIELIITDDASKDNTIDICKKWIEVEKERFLRTQLVTVIDNTGIAANCNRGFRASTGTWIKFIAADDRLLPNCIADNIDFVFSNTSSQIIFSKVKGIGNLAAAEKWPWKDVGVYFREMSQRQFKIKLYDDNFLPASSAFIKRICIEQLGGYDESFHLIEDWPFWMKAINKGFIFSFLDKETVEYRFSNSSVSLGCLSKEYRNEMNKASQLGVYYLSEISFFARFLVFTSSHRNTNWFIRVLYVFNVLNPFYYEFKKMRRISSLLVCK